MLHNRRSNKKHDRWERLFFLQQVHNYIGPIFPLRNTSFSKLPVVNDDLFGLRMPDPRLKSLSTAAEDGRGVLYFCSLPVPQEQVQPGVSVEHREMVGRDRGGVHQADIIVSKYKYID